MSASGKKPTQREYTEGEQSDSLISRRARAFADRSRDPGDATTWAVVLGAVICTLLMFCFAAGGHPRLAMASVAVTVMWIFVVSRYGRVNVAAVLWGAATTDTETPPEHLVVFRATAALAAVSLLAIIIDALTGWSFRWYSVGLLAAILAFLGVSYRTWIAPAR